MSDGPKVLHVAQAGKATNNTQVYIGRPSRFGNPFVIGRHGTREEVIELYRRYFYGSGTLMSEAHRLKGKNLVCYCAPLPCHGDILLEFANKES